MITVSCNCGVVALELIDAPIMAVECLCNSCRAAGRFMQSLPGASPLLDEKGATRSVIYRKDRIRCTRGGEALREFRLTPASKTRRVVASCYNAAMFLDFTSGHWLDVYAGRWPDGVGPSAEMRTMVGDLPPGTELSADIPNSKGHSARFFAKLIAAWMAMRFRTPKIDFVQGKLDAAVQ